jgi:hypothetical protein
LTGTYPNPTVAAGGVAISDLSGYPADATKYARGDNTFSVIAAASSTTGGGLPTSPSTGAPGRIKGGASPFDFLTLYYDATLGRYVSAPFLLGSISLASPTSTSNVYASVTASEQLCFFQPMKVFTGAGLSIQARLAGIFRSGSASVAAFVAALIQGVNAGGTLGNVVAAEILEQTDNSGADTFKDSGWTDVTTTSNRDFMNGILRCKVASGTITISRLSLWGRWYVAA